MSKPSSTPMNLKLRPDVMEALALAAESHGRTLAAYGNEIVLYGLSNALAPDEVVLFRNTPPSEQSGTDHVSE